MNFIRFSVVVSLIIILINSQDVSGQLNHMDISASKSHCPSQPIPVDLPSPLPDVINNALNELGTLTGSFVDSMDVPGGVVGVTYKGKTLFTKGFGVKDPTSNTSKVPPDADTIFRIGSVSKIFPVIMLYQLYEEGKIHSLDDPLQKYAPNFKINNPFSKRNLTLRQMASQLSGLPRELCKLESKEGNICPLTNEEVLERVKNWYVLNPSWAVPSYSNLAYALLGNLINEHHGEWPTFEEYAMNRIAQPLELDNTGFTYTDEVKQQMAVGYIPGGFVAPLTNIGYEAPAGQMYSTINDLNKLSQFFYEANILPFLHKVPESKVLSFDLRREMSLPYYVNPDRQTGFSTPWEMFFRGNYTIRTKGGAIFGYSAFFSFIPELHLGINALFSGPVDVTTFGEKAYDILLPPLVSNLSEYYQFQFPLPPNPYIYVGHYLDLGVAEANIYFDELGLWMAFQTLKPGMEFSQLAYYDVGIFQKCCTLWPTSQSCLKNELERNPGEWLYFDPVDDSGKPPGFSVPPLYLKRV